MRSVGLLALAVFLLPASVQGAVIIHEVAWMGTTVSANDEWIELANPSTAAVDLAGWRLISSSGSPSITLTGTIAAGGYFLLERSSDDSVPGITADQIYTGSLTNSGATLTLSDMSGASVDVVVGGTNWTDIGGDNTTKDTPQRSGNAWVTAAPTPRAATVGNASSSGSADASSESGSSISSGSSGSSGAATLSPTGISLEIGVSRKGFVHVPLTFTAKTKSGIADPSARVFWNFGDGSMTEGREVEKTYHYEGVYVVTAKAVGAQASAQDELIVTVRSAAVYIRGMSGEGITLANQSMDRVDLSNWRIATPEGSFRFPEGTVLLPESEVLFPSAVTRLQAVFEGVLEYPSGRPAAQFPSLELQPQVMATSSQEVQEVEPIISFSKSPSYQALSHAAEIVAPAAATNLAAAGAALPQEQEEEPLVQSSALADILESPWFLGLLGVIALGGAALMIL